MELAQCKRFTDDSGRYEYKQFGLVVAAFTLPEQKSNVRKVTQERNTRRHIAHVLCIDSANHNRSTVLDQNLGLDMLGIDGDPVLNCNLNVRRVLVDV